MSSGHAGPADRAPSGERPRLRPLSLVDDGEQVIVGDPQAGRFVAMPPIGAVVIRALQGGATVAEAAETARQVAGEPVDVTAFVATLGRLGFLDDGDPADGPAASAVQLTRWWHGPSRAAVRPLFGRAAWTCYVLAFAFAAGCLVAVPELRPHRQDALPLDDGGADLLLLLLATSAMTALHECWHWLAAVAAGVPARFGIDRRLYFVIFETDLSQIWRLPRRQRYGPVLAGLAADSTVLAVLLALRLAARSGPLALPDLAVRLLAMLTFAKLALMVWQCLVFLRTDLYAAFVIATGCRNLWRVKTLLLRRAFGLPRPGDAAELASAHPRDVRIGRWFRWFWLAGVCLAVAWFWAFYLPILIHVTAWIGDGLATGPRDGFFWYAAACLVLLAWAPALLTARALRRIPGRRRAMTAGR